LKRKVNFAGKKTGENKLWLLAARGKPLGKVGIFTEGLGWKKNLKGNQSSPLKTKRRVMKGSCRCEKQGRLEKPGKKKKAEKNREPLGGGNM